LCGTGAGEYEGWQRRAVWAGGKFFPVGYDAQPVFRNRAEENGSI